MTHRADLHLPSATRRCPHGRGTATLLTILAVSACGGPTAQTDSGAGDAPAFSGPYAAEFEEYYTTTESDFVRSALADEVISDAEYAEMVDRFDRCLADQGIDFLGFEPNGSYRAGPAPEGVDSYAAIAACSTESGHDTIGVIHDLMYANPDNEDTFELMAECLVRLGVKESGYTAEDYAQESESTFTQFDTLSEEVKEALFTCSEDPYTGVDQ